VDDAFAQGGTRLYDAVVTAAAMLRGYVQTHPGCVPRILCLSDGADTCSSISARQVAVWGPGRT
jgi:hypothetical protein